MQTLKHLLEKNREWASDQLEEDPEFFARLVAQQQPEYLWIGCSDSRVPANQITGLAPGEVFVHRNVANLVVQTDFSMLSVLQYAIDVLKVRHVIVCGHYGCGGVQAALETVPHGIIDNWLRHIRNIARRQVDELQDMDPGARIDRLCELNVLANAENIARSTIVEDAWGRGQMVGVHSWIYDLANGLIKPLAPSINGPVWDPAIFRGPEAGKLPVD